MTRRPRAAFATFMAVACAAAIAVAVARAAPAPHHTSPAAHAAQPEFAAPADSDSSAVADLQREAITLAPQITTPWVREFLAATARLPHITPRTIMFDSSRTHFYWEAETESMPDTARAQLVTRRLDEGYYYTTRYGTPLAYSRPFELLAAAGVHGPRGLRLCDFGYGTVGHLRLLASLGADVVGIEVDPLLEKLYSMPGDQGDVASAGGDAGHVKLVDGHWPGDADVADAVGQGFDVFISKNTLKNGYIHPERPVDPRRLVHLEVSDSTFVASVARVLKPGGLAMIYNICPAPAPPDKPYIPWADGRCPFPRAMWEAQGFEVLEFDRNDDTAVRAMAHALGWDKGEGAMDLEHDLFATWTLARKKAR